MLPLSVRKRMNPGRTRSPLGDVGNVKEFSASPATAKIIQTSPQRRAFSKILQMLHNANASRCTCNKENERFTPKLIKLLKQARKEKYHLEEKLELTMLKARRDLVSASKYWGEKVGNLKVEHATALQEYEAMLASNAEECRHLRVRNEELVNEVISTERQLISLQAATANESGASRDESAITKLLQEQLEERNALIQYEQLQKVQVRTAHESQLRSIREENEQVMETARLQLLHVMQILHEVQDQKDTLTQGANIHRLHEELAVISRTLKNCGFEWSPRASGTIDMWTPRASGTIETQGTESCSPVSSSTAPLPTLASDVFEDCITEGEDDDQPTMVIASSESHSCESSPYVKQGENNVYDINSYEHVVDQLEDRLEAAGDIQVALQRQVDHLRDELESTSMEQSYHENENENDTFRFQEDLELSKQTLREERQARLMLNEEYERLRQYHEAMRSATAVERLQKDQMVSDLTSKLEYTTLAASIAEAEAEEVQKTMKRMQDDHARTVEELRIHCETTMIEAQEVKQVVAELRGKFENAIFAVSVSEVEVKKIQETLKRVENEHAATVETLTTQYENSMKELRDTTTNQLQISSTLRQELFDCKQEFSVSQKAIYDLKRKDEFVKSQLEQQIANSSRELAVAHETIVELRNEVAHLEHRLDVEELRRDLEISKKKTRHEAQLVASCQQLYEAREEATELKTLLEQIKGEHAASLQSLAKIGQEKDGMALERNIRHQQEVATLNGQLCQAKEEISNLRIHIRAVEYKHEATLQSLQEAIDAAQKQAVTDEYIKELESRHAYELLDKENTNLRFMEEKKLELSSLRQLYDNLEQENQRIRDEISTQILSVEAANEAEVLVLKQYTQQLEGSLEKHRKALSESHSRQDDLIDQIDRLEEPTRLLLSSPIGTNDNGRENDENSCLFSPGFDHSRLGEIQELRRGLFAADVFDESEAGEYRRRADDSSILDQSSSEPEPRRSEAHIVPCTSPNKEFMDFDDCLDEVDWQERCLFIENDRDDLVRMADEIIEEERVTHQWQLEAAIATARREAAEHLLQQELWTRQQMTMLYEGLCSKCRHKIDTA